MHGTTFESFSTSENRGAIVSAVFALLSASAFVFMVMRIIRLAMMLFREPDDNIMSRPPEILFFRTQLGHYAGSLILSNMFISVAGLINFSWAARSEISQGVTCSVQGVLVEIGIWGTCWFTVAHGLHTLSSLGFHVRPSRWNSWASVALGWMVALVAGLAPLLLQSNIYGPTGTSCAVIISYPSAILVLEALPILFSASVLILAYFVMFVVLSRKLNGKLVQNVQDPDSVTQRGDERNEEYYRFICVIIRSLFWFPFVFILLCLPFCITHILMFVRYKVPFAATVFADICISMLGFVNVGLLFNTFRIIAPVYFKRRAAAGSETVETFGNDASSESPVVAQSRPYRQSTMISHESSYPAYRRWSSCHSNDSSWSGSANSNTGLLGPEKSSCKSTRTKVAPLALKNVIPVTGLGHTTLISLQKNTGRRQDEALARDENSSLQSMENIGVTGKDVKKLTLESEIPATLNLPLNKSTVLATRLGIPVAAAGTAPPSSDVHSARELKTEQATDSMIPATPIHQFDEVNLGSPAIVVIPSSPASTMTTGTEGDSEYFWEIVHAHKVQSPPQIQECDDEDDTVTPRFVRASMATVWSQETGYSFSLDWNEELQDAYQELMGNMLGDQADVGEVVTRPASALLSTGTSTRRCKSHLRPIKVVSKMPTQLPSIPETPK